MGGKESIDVDGFWHLHRLAPVTFLTPATPTPKKAAAADSAPVELALKRNLMKNDMLASWPQQPQSCPPLGGAPLNHID